MIFDALSHAHVYMRLSDHFEKAIAWLRETDLTVLPTGRHAIAGEQVYAMVQENTLCDWEAGKWESHKKYADIQMVISGREVIGFCDVASLAEAEYDAQKDLILYPEAAGQKATLAAGDMMILYPWDAHRPGIAPSQEERTVRKVVVKVLL